MTDTIWVCDCGSNKGKREIPHGRCIHCNSSMKPFVPQSKLSLATDALKLIAQAPKGKNNAFYKRTLAKTALEALETEVDGD